MVEWAVLEATESVAVGLAIGPSPRRIELPAGYRPAPGVGVTLREGADAMFVSYGPEMLHEALTAAELLAERGVEAAVVAMPWLDRVDPGWLAETFGGVREVLVVEDHAPVGALGDTLRRAFGSLGEPAILRVAGVEGWPACGPPPEAVGTTASTGRRSRIGSRWRCRVAPAREQRAAGVGRRRRPADRANVLRLRERRASGAQGSATGFASRSFSGGRRRGMGRARARRRARSSMPTTCIRRMSRFRSASSPGRPMARRARRLLPARDPLNLRHRFHRERMLPGHRNQLLTRRASGRPASALDRAGDASVAFLATPAPSPARCGADSRPSGRQSCSPTCRCSRRRRSSCSAGGWGGRGAGTWRAGSTRSGRA